MVSILPTSYYRSQHIIVQFFVILWFNLPKPLILEEGIIFLWIKLLEPSFYIFLIKSWIKCFTVYEFMKKTLDGDRHATILTHFLSQKLKIYNYAVLNYKYSAKKTIGQWMHTSVEGDQRVKKVKDSLLSRQKISTKCCSQFYAI